MIKTELPWDLLEEILCRVPAASLTRLRYTCKVWNRLFKDRRFARKHLDKATKQSLILMLKKFRVSTINNRINLYIFSPEKLIGELINLAELHYSLGQTEIFPVSHCDGLLLCGTNTGLLVVWNPCTGQTRFIDRYEQYTMYAFGSYQDKKSSDNISYKILRRRGGYGNNKEYKIYDINSNSWRILDVTLDFSINGLLNHGVSLKGKTYWIAIDEKEGHLGTFLLVSFDYTTERFERLCLPDQYPSHRDLYLSVVREEKLSLLLKGDGISKIEIWVTNKISEETKVVSWSMVLTVDLGPEIVTLYGGSFWIDEEEKKVLVWGDNVLYKYKIFVHIVGEEIKVERESSTEMPFFYNYVPSLTQI